MAISEATLRENYRKLPDDKLMRIVAEDAAKLRPEALVVLREELQVRGLAEVAEKSIQAQLRVLSNVEIDQYSALIQALPCPLCHSTSQALNATMTSKVLSFIVMTTEKKAFVIACPSCLDKLTSEASTSSALLGWWGIPWGIIRTIQALVFNSKMGKGHHMPYANDLLKSFVVDNVGRIEAAQKSVSGLQRIITVAPQLARV